MTTPAGPTTGPAPAVRVYGKHDGTGPVHLCRLESPDLSWCGSRQQFRHIERDGTVEDVTCKTCLRRIRLGRPLAFGARS